MAWRYKSWNKQKHTPTNTIHNQARKQTTPAGKEARESPGIKKIHHFSDKSSFLVRKDSWERSKHTISWWQPATRRPTAPSTLRSLPALGWLKLTHEVHDGTWTSAERRLPRETSWDPSKLWETRREPWTAKQFIFSPLSDLVWPCQRLRPCLYLYHWPTVNIPSWWIMTHRPSEHEETSATWAHNILYMTIWIIHLGQRPLDKKMARNTDLRISRIFNRD